MTKEIIIDSYIGPGYYSKQYVRAMLANEKNKDVTIKISSLGGDLDHAVDIHDQFAEHGNVTVEFNGFNASSATIISLGAAKVKISCNSYYLIHKVASWVDEWGYMNDDDLDKLITELEAEKDENKKITLNVARMYVNRTGKSTKEILDLMKKESWLTAEEALEWGFVDEIYEPKTKVNHLENSRMVALISAAGFPLPDRKFQKSNTMSDKKTEFAKDEKSLKAWINSVFGISPKENNQVTDDPEDQDKRISELEAKIAKLEKAKSASKKNSVDTEKSKKIASLETKLAELEAGSNDDSKKSNDKKSVKTGNESDENSKENNKAAADKQAEIDALELQIKNLKNSSTSDNDVVKSNDKNKSNNPDEFRNAIDEAKEMVEYINGDN